MTTSDTISLYLSHILPQTKWLDAPLPVNNMYWTIGSLNDHILVLSATIVISQAKGLTCQRQGVNLINLNMYNVCEK